MPKPKDQNGVPLPAAHLRLEEEGPKLRNAAVLAMAHDPRSCSLTTAQKVRLANQAIDHVVDGSSVPARVFAKDGARHDNRFMYDIWELTVIAIRAKWRDLNPGLIR